MYDHFVKGVKAITLASHLLMHLEQSPCHSILAVIATILKNIVDLHSKTHIDNDKF